MVHQRHLLRAALAFCLLAPVACGAAIGGAHATVNPSTAGLCAALARVRRVADQDATATAETRAWLRQLASDAECGAN